ncbi:MAG: haloacid dehalogenase, partial [Muribaculaceae bacterium]|nr:haloacid dehalogenase [Muribaculaceae bacterium]
MSHTHQYKGLSPAEVEESRRVHGSNVLTPPKQVSVWKRFFEKFRDPLIVILLCAGVLSVAISIYEYCYIGQGASVFFEPAGIFLAIILATGLGFLLELKADREFAILNRVNDDEAVQVIRDGHVTEVPRRDVVVGDIVIISTGAEIPADGTLLESVTLSVDESSLTGEPVCSKDADPTKTDPEATFPSYEVLRGTKVMEGHGIM